MCMCAGEMVCVSRSCLVLVAVAIKACKRTVPIMCGNWVHIGNGGLITYPKICYNLGEAGASNYTACT